MRSSFIDGGKVVVSSWNTPTKLMATGILLCMVYYAFSGWLSYSRLTGHFTLWGGILFGSSVAGLQVSLFLLLPFSRESKRVLGYLLAINGGLSAVGWILFIPNLIFVFGFAQFFYFMCSTFQEDKNHGQI